ncbi:MAG TPA: NAD-glutamate dehydrogenase domain-containing protein [Acidimicrobiales bacterium]|nr:NAD-glutamate dehydrogenase domain-containing protein [Acidimicrobiales bacterium]
MPAPGRGLREAAPVMQSDDPTWDAEVERLAGAARASEIAGFLSRLPAGYRALTSPAEAVEDQAEMALLQHPPAGSGPTPPGDASPGPALTGSGPTAGGHRAMGTTHRLLVRPSSDPVCTFRLRRFGEEGIELTSTLPLLESFGLVVVESVPLRLGPGAAGEPEMHLDDIGLRADTPYGPEALRFVPAVHGARLVDAIEASARGDADVDSLNRLVTAAGLDWRQVMVLRAYLRYWRQSGVPLTWEQMTDPLAAYPDVARALIGYFEARFDPAAQPTAGAAQQTAGAAAGAAGERGAADRALVLAQLDLVSSLEEDRVLRSVLTLVDATLRTNFFTGAGAGGRPLVLKLDSRRVPDLPRPRPQVEAFVHGPTVEGVHLRAGLIARGGLRWSERPEDFRTEVLDLAFAQVKKNAIIVPTGAKGGFVCRSKGRPGPQAVRAAYETFVSGLLEITDNLVDGRLVAPPGVVAADGPDPYLVVAADKGTATFSDLANSISERFGFWLGDAFASGGSRGYDHKAMGITAKGAWVAVRRHFRELGIDVSRDPITVAGVGDMSGDVFGNGMLRSRAMRLVAAFDHRHVFLDPDPDPAASFEERRRLASLDRSSWADYKPELISAGGGVWPRDAKSVPLSPAARRVLGVEEPNLSPPEVVSAILAAPVDLLWFGGIGTYVKAPGEPDSDVGDHSNDAVRITSDRVRARVVAEGANLGVTQRARIRYSRRGGRINADFIDNAAGVATSDREVNLKILLALAIERGRLAPADRDRYLSGAEEEVATEVLRQVDHSVAALNRAAAGSDRYLDAYEALIDDLERAGRFDRQVEVLPDRDEFAVRRQAGAGLIRPELATLLTYAKTDLVAAIEDADWNADPFLLGSVTPYFPRDIRDDFGDLIRDHRLYRQLVATDVAGEIVDQMGVVWAHDLAAEVGRPLDQVAAAFWAARHVVGAADLWAELERLAADPASELTAPGETALHQTVSGAVTRLVRSYLSEPGGLRPGEVAERDAKRLSAAGPLPDAPAGGEERWAELEIPAPLGQRFLAAALRVEQLDAVAVAVAAGQGPEAAARAADILGRLDAAAGLDRLESSVTAVLDSSPPPGRLRLWQAQALLDDLGDWRRRVAAAVLAGSESGALEGTDPVSNWVAAHADDLRRVADVAPTGTGEDALASATLALRRLSRATAT